MGDSRVTEKEGCEHYQVHRSIDHWYCTECGLEFRPVKEKGDVHG